MVGNSFYKTTRFYKENWISVFDAFKFQVENKFNFQLDFTEFDLGENCLSQLKKSKLSKQIFNY